MPLFILFRNMGMPSINRDVNAFEVIFNKIFMDFSIEEKKNIANSFKHFIWIGMNNDSGICCIIRLLRYIKPSYFILHIILFQLL